jgi:hypothetical protein
MRSPASPAATHLVQRTHTEKENHPTNGSFPISSKAAAFEEWWLVRGETDGGGSYYFLYWYFLHARQYF